MFDQLLSLVKENAGNDIINNNAIPNERNEEAVETTARTISDSLKGAVQSGNLSDVMNLFNDGGNNVSSLPLAQNMQGNLIDKLMKQFGLSNSQAGGIAASLIPSILGKFVRKTNDPNDNSFDLSSILSQFGGSNFDVSSVLNQFGVGGNKQGGSITDSLKNILGK